MSSDTLARIQLVQLEVDRLMSEAQTPGVSLERVTAIREEMEVLLESMREIRRQQLVDEIEQANPPKKRRWWRKERPS